MPTLARPLALLALAAAPLTLAAQSNPVELGMDAGLVVQLGEPSRTAFDIPRQQVRANFFLDRNWSLETRLGYQRSSVENGGSSSQLGVEIGPMFHFGSTTRFGSRPIPDWYVRPSLLLASGSVNPENGPRRSDTDVGFAAAIGTRVPLVADRLALRLEGQLGKFADADDGFLALGIGFSFFIR